jgi:hypothetical protein
MIKMARPQDTRRWSRTKKRYANSRRTAVKQPLPPPQRKSLHQICRENNIPIISEEQAEAAMEKYKEEYCRKKATERYPCPPPKPSMFFACFTHLSLVSIPLISVVFTFKECDFNSVSQILFCLVVGIIFISFAGLICILFRECWREKLKGYQTALKENPQRQKGEFDRILRGSDWRITTLRCWYKSMGNPIPAEHLKNARILEEATNGEVIIHIFYFEEDPWMKAYLDGQAFYFAHFDI